MPGHYGTCPSLLPAAGGVQTSGQRGEGMAPARRKAVRWRFCFLNLLFLPSFISCCCKAGILPASRSSPPINGLEHLTHPENVNPVVVGAEIHAELDQELAHLQHRQLGLMLHGLASLGPSCTAGIAARALPSLPRNAPQHSAEEQPCSGLALLVLQVLWHTALTASVLAVTRSPLLGGGSCAACCKTSGKGKR